MSVFGIVGLGAAALVVVSWLVISFSQPSRRRTQLEWLAASGLYVALLALFVNLTLRAHDGDNLFAVVAFGFLGALFGTGLLIAAYELVRSFAGSVSSEASATN